MERRNYDLNHDSNHQSLSTPEYRIWPPSYLRGVRNRISRRRKSNKAARRARRVNRK